MTSSESSMLVYFAGPAAARTDLIPEFRAKTLSIYENPSKDFVEALDHVEKLVKDAMRHPRDSAADFMFRRKLCACCRDVKVVSGKSPEYPLMAAKSAILVANDYSDGD